MTDLGRIRSGERGYRGEGLKENPYVYAAPYYATAAVTASALSVAAWLSRLDCSVTGGWGLDVILFVLAVAIIVVSWGYTCYMGQFSILPRNWNADNQVSFEDTKAGKAKYQDFQQYGVLNVETGEGVTPLSSPLYIVSVLVLLFVPLIFLVVLMGTPEYRDDGGDHACNYQVGIVPGISWFSGISLGWALFP